MNLPMSAVLLLCVALVTVLLFVIAAPAATNAAVDNYHSSKGTLNQGNDELPSVRKGLMNTANDVSTESVVLSSEADALTHIEKKPSVNIVSSSVCSAAVWNTFTERHRAVLRNNSDYLERRREASGDDSSVAADKWSGPSPVCGIHMLYNITGEMFTIQHFQTTFEQRTEQRIRLENCAKANGEATQAKYTRGDGEPQGHCTDLYIASRLVGPSIVAGRIYRQENCGFEIAFVVEDPGRYQLEIQVVWLDGLGPEKKVPSHPIILRKIHSKFGKKPHQKYVFNEACERQTHIVGSPFDVTVTASSLGSSAAKELPICTFEHRHGHGRWIHHHNDVPCNSTTLYCSGDPSLLNDAKPFNEDFLWAPLECRFHFYGYRQGPSRPCANRKGPMLLMGDSTTREYAQNLKLFDLSKSNLQPSYANWKLDWQYFSRPMAEKSVARLGHELQGSRPVVLAANLGPLHLIGGLKTSEWEFYVDQWEKLFRTQDLRFIEKKVFIGPAAVHYATNDMTAQRMMNWMSYAQKKLEPLGFQYVAAWNMTEGRPESSWDGVHYAAEKGKAQMKKIRRKRRVFKWNGGVSVMLTNALINFLCPDG